MLSVLRINSRVGSSAAVFKAPGIKIVNGEDEPMNKLKRTIVGLGLLAGATVAQAEGGYLFCVGEYRDIGGDGQSEVYISSVFHASEILDHDIENRYGKFIDSRYSPGGAVYDVNCRRYVSDTKREAEFEREDVISDWSDLDYRLHKVRWSY